jgi:aspartate ammonia-lyase
MSFRIEHDLLGTREVPAEALYGIYTLRAVENFPLSGRPVHAALIHAYGAVKLACARTNNELNAWRPPPDGKRRGEDWQAAIEQACGEMMEGKLDEHIIVDALQGGAGTSTNMNVNEVLANRAQQILGRGPGDYDCISATEDINLHQSTNDTYPTALRVAAMTLLAELEREVTALQEAFQAKEKQFAGVVKIGRTQLQDAVLTTLGRSMGAYAEAIGRDRWRIYKCAERLRVVNLGGTAIGTGQGAPRQFIFRAVEHLRSITSLPLARAENLVEATQNVDALVEVSGILKALATNLAKIGNDLRLLSSGPSGGLGEIRLPAVQPGSSIMPGKINPVIPEAVVQAALTVIANDGRLTQAAAMGNLELSQFYPLMAEALLESLTLLGRTCGMLRTRCVEGIEADETRCRSYVDGGTALLTALLERIGYERATEIAEAAQREGKTVREIILERGLLGEDELSQLLSPENVMKLGSRRPGG